MEKHITLLNFYGEGQSEKWPIDTIPQKKDLIVIGKIKAIVVFNEYVFSKDGKICNVFIHTKKIN